MQLFTVDNRDVEMGHFLPTALFPETSKSFVVTMANSSSIKQDKVKNSKPSHLYGSYCYKYICLNKTELSIII